MLEKMEDSNRLTKSEIGLKLEGLFLSIQNSNEERLHGIIFNCELWSVILDISYFHHHYVNFIKSLYSN